MTKTKSTKRALLGSALALLVCVSMLIGSTFAWFTDSVTSAGNIIKSGTLNVTMEWADGTKAVPADDSTDWKNAADGAIFKSELWEPGYTEVRHIKIANEGTLALKYQLNIIANGEVSELADVIDVYYVDPAVQVADRTAFTDANKLGTLTQVLANINTTASGTLLADEKTTITLALKMQESAGNEYQGLSIGSDFSVQLLATQLTSENDSFDNTYDSNAWLNEADYSWYDPNNTTHTIKNAAELAGLAAIVNGTAATTYGARATAVPADNFRGETVVLAADIDLNGMPWTPIGNSTNKFNGTFDAKGYTVSNLVIIGDNSDVGLFGFTSEGEIKNLTVKNAKVKGYLNVGVVAGTPYTSKFTNIKVTGHVEVNGFAYVGGVGGKNAYANWSNITVDVDSKSYVNAVSTKGDKHYRTYVGGVVGFNGEGGHTFKNITSNINVIGDVCDIGGVFGIAHYGNNFENITCTGNVTGTYFDSSSPADADEIGGIAGVWNNGGENVTFTNCKFTGVITPADASVDVSNNTIVGLPYSASGKGKLIIDGVELASNFADLKASLSNSDSVTFSSNITFSAKTDGESNGYGNTGLNVNNGQTIDGNGYELKVQGANGTWDSAINTTGGTIKNLTISQGFRGIFINHNSTVSSKVFLENVTIDGPVYTISCDQGTNNGLEATNCTFKGWTSYAATIGNVKFTNCYFGAGAGYNFSRPYASTTYVGCDFAAGHQLDARAAITFENCTINGAPLTAENLSTLVINGTSNVTVK